MSFLPAEYSWFQPVLIAAIVVFIVGLIGNVLTFSNRFANALVTAVLFAIIFGLLAFFGLGSFEVKTDAAQIPTLFLPAQYLWLEPVLLAAMVVFIVDLIGNILTFSNRIVNALATAVVFAIIFGGLTFYGYGSVNTQIQTTPAANAPATQLKQ